MRVVTRRDARLRRFGKKGNWIPWKIVPTKARAKLWAATYRARSKGNRARVVKMTKGYIVYVR